MVSNPLAMQRAIKMFAFAFCAGVKVDTIDMTYNNKCDGELNPFNES
jgi:hypothetical protein